MDAMYFIEDQKDKSEQNEGHKTWDMGRETWGKEDRMWRP